MMTKRKTINQMLDDVCAKWGLEHEVTIRFATLLDWPDVSRGMVEVAYDTAMALSQFDEE